ncbi:NYN domain-containing protein [Alteromonas sp. ASW11-130]|uniref:NYN domain-containing protein n=1 Tax=Alteromonas sp. ASW11-130 TaxID=3015775 RepID=UPI002241990C|nr:NYN domain-containing protein [Alteromonas sp. ASW11-130]MCW8090855.1 NYN domain-containing protein [Alteromonas sp. ASW11-130]
MDIIKPRVAVFVDVQNIYYTTRQAYKQNFNYNKFWRLISSQYEIVKAFAYAVDRGDKKQQEFQNILRAIGFEVKLKPFIQRADGSAKGDWDVGITIDVMDYSDDVDKVVLVSGDGDFDILVERLKSGKGVEVDVYGVPALTATSLVNAASQYIEIDNNLLLS